MAQAKIKSLPYFDKTQMTPFWSEDSSSDKLQRSQVPKFAVLDQSGETVTDQKMKGHPSLVNFFFADCPKLCPLMMQSLQSFLNKTSDAQKDLKIFSFSVEPEKDRPQVLKRYAKDHHISLAHWTLLTGPKEQIYQIGKDVFKADGSVGAQRNPDSFIHTRNVYLVDADLYIRGIYDTADRESMALLADDLQLLSQK
jgi:protein SCO1/2